MESIRLLCAQSVEWLALEVARSAETARSEHYCNRRLKFALMGLLLGAVIVMVKIGVMMMLN